MNIARAIITKIELVQLLKNYEFSENDIKSLEYIFKKFIIINAPLKFSKIEPSYYFGLKTLLYNISPSENEKIILHYLS